jgi:hypothetical protein
MHHPRTSTLAIGGTGLENRFLITTVGMLSPGGHQYGIPFGHVPRRVLHRVAEGHGLLDCG